MSRVESWVARFEHLAISTLQSVNRVLVQIVVITGIWAADAVVSVRTGNNLIAFLGWDTFSAVLAAIALEASGVMASVSALQLHRFNQQRGSQPAAPEGLAWVVAAVQVAISVAIMILSAFVANGVVISGVLIALLSATATASMVLHEDCQVREKQRDISPSPQPHAPVPSARDKVLAFYLENPHAKQQAVAEATGVCRQRVGQLRQELLAEGAIDGDGEGR